MGDETQGSFGVGNVVVTTNSLGSVALMDTVKTSPRAGPGEVPQLGLRRGAPEVRRKYSSCTGKATGRLLMSLG